MILSDPRKCSRRRSTSSPSMEEAQDEATSLLHTMLRLLFEEEVSLALQFLLRLFRSCSCSRRLAIWCKFITLVVGMATRQEESLVCATRRRKLLRLVPTPTFEFCGTPPQDSLARISKILGNSRTRVLIMTSCTLYPIVRVRVIYAPRGPSSRSPIWVGDCHRPDHNNNPKHPPR